MSSPDSPGSSLLGKWFKRLSSSHTHTSSNTPVDVEPVVTGREGEPPARPSTAPTPSSHSPSGVMPLVLDAEGHGPSLQLRSGNVVNLSADMVAVPTGPRLRRSRGCFRVVNKATQGLLSRLSSEYVRCNGRMKTGEAQSFSLDGSQSVRYKMVVCVVTPRSIEHSLERGTSLLHAGCHAVLEEAFKHKTASLVVPALGAGLDGFENKVSDQSYST